MIDCRDQVVKRESAFRIEAGVLRGVPRHIFDYCRTPQPKGGEVGLSCATLFVGAGRGRGGAGSEEGNEVGLFDRPDQPWRAPRGDAA